MKYNPEKHNRRSIRLKGHDYSSNGYYFITIGTKNRKCWLGKIKNGFIPTAIGRIAAQCWQEIPKHFPNVTLDEFVIMPNHIHGILIINNVSVVGAQYFVPLQGNNIFGAQNIVPQHNQFQKIIPKSIGSIIRGFKIGVTKWCRNNGHGYFSWQRNYYDHIIRDNKSLHRIRKYIINNPQYWEEDRNNEEWDF